MISMKKSTGELLELLKNSKSIKSYIELKEENLQNLTLSEYLNNILDEKHLTKSDVIKRSNLNNIYAYKIFSGERNPERNKLLCLCFGMSMTLDEVQRALKIADCGALYPRVRRDSIIIFAINEQADLLSCNEMLYELNEDILE